MLSSKGRFKQNNGVVIDTLTGHIWSRNANPAEYPLSWREAHDFISELNKNAYAGFSNWHMPDRRALFSLISHQHANPSLPSHHPFENVFPGYYWSSDTCSRLQDQAWYVHLGGGRVFRGMKHGAYLTWPVISEIRQDPPKGERFAFAPPLILDLGRQTTWLLDHPHLRTPLTWQEALESIHRINREKAFGCSRWHLPNIREFENLVNIQTHSPAIFNDIKLNGIEIKPGYWSSTTSTYEPSYAWVLYTRDGEVGVGFKRKSDFFSLALTEGILQQPSTRSPGPPTVGGSFISGSSGPRGQVCS